MGFRIYFHPPNTPVSLLTPSPLLPILPPALSPSPAFCRCVGAGGFLMMSRTKENVGDFLCASVIWFCPEAALSPSLLSGGPEPWKSDIPRSPFSFSCGLCEWAPSPAIVAWFSDVSHWIQWPRVWRAVLAVHLILPAGPFTGIVSPHRLDLCIVANNGFCWVG